MSKVYNKEELQLRINDILSYLRNIIEDPEGAGVYFSDKLADIFMDVLTGNGDSGINKKFGMVTLVKNTIQFFANEEEYNIYLEDPIKNRDLLLGKVTLPSNTSTTPSIPNPNIDLSNYVTLNTDQNISGIKNFLSGIKINNSPILTYDSTTESWLLEGNLIVTGGGAFRAALGDLNVPTIMDAILVDEQTITKDVSSGQPVLKVLKAGLDPTELEEYLKPYIKSVNDLSTKFDNFLTGSDTDTIINKWKELETFLSGLSESDNLATLLSGKADKATTLAGYGITDAYTKSHIDINFVTIGTKQEITGEKDFVGGFKVNGGLVEYNATLKTWVLNGDLLVTGGVSAFSNISDFKPSTITEAVLIDNKTIKRNADGLLYAVAQETDGINEDQLADYLATNGYATQDWVTGKGYLTGITGTMVTNALGYTPYNSSNPAGYITSSGSITGNAATSNRLIEEVVTDLNNATVGRIFTMTSGYGSTGGNKPNEGWVTGITLQYAQNGAYRRQLAYSDVDLYIREEHNGVWEKWRKILTSTNFYNYALPITGGTVNGNVRINKFLAVGAASSSTNTARAQIHLVSSGANPCDLYFGADDTLYWSVTTRNASDAGGFNKAFALYDVTNSAYRLMVLPNGNIGIGGTTASEKLHVYGNIKLTGDLDGGVYFLRSSNAANPLLRLAVGSQYYYVQAMAEAIYVGATSATSLKVTPTGDTTVMGNLLATGALSLGRNNRTHIIENPFAASGMTLADVNKNPLVTVSYYSDHAYVYNYKNSKKNSGIAFYDDGRVVAAQNFICTGGVTAQNSSDRRLKRNIRKFNAREVLMSLGGVYEYEYLDSEVQKNHIYKGTHFGLIYQHVKGTKLDVMCHKREDGFGTLNYIHPKFISLIAGATMENISEVDKLKREIRHLKAKVKQLEQRS